MSKWPSFFNFGLKRMLHSQKADRLVALDFWRTLAIFLVLCRHYGGFPFLEQAGWVGVDIFFVLSGFLVADMLRREWQRTNRINAIRFIWRRSLKILPSFALLLLLTACLQPFVQSPFLDFRLRNFLAEITFLQGYIGRIWNHTWSLAIEEHFYLIFLALSLFLKYWGSRIWWYAALVTILVCVVLRLDSLRQIGPIFFIQGIQSHCRIDSLFVGVLAFLSKDWLTQNLFRPYSRLSVSIFSLSILTLLLLLFFFSNKSFWTLSVGFSFYAVLIAYCMVFSTSSFFKFLGLVFIKRLCIFFSKRSYCIYLFHSPVLVFLMPFVENHALASSCAAPLYFLLSVLVGCLIYEGLEYPILAWRDKHWP